MRGEPAAPGCYGPKDCCDGKTSTAIPALDTRDHAAADAEGPRLPGQCNAASRAIGDPIPINRDKLDIHGCVSRAISMITSEATNVMVAVCLADGVLRNSAAPAVISSAAAATPSTTASRWTPSSVPGIPATASASAFST